MPSGFPGGIVDDKPGMNEHPLPRQVKMVKMGQNWVVGLASWGVEKKNV